MKGAMMEERKGSIWPGFILAVIVGYISWYLADMHKAIDSLVAGIVLGIVIRSIIGERARLVPGLVFAPKVFIPAGIILYGVNLKFQKLATVPSFAWFQVIVGMVVIFLIALWAGKRLKVRDKTSLLIATGTSICGASAIAIATPVIKGKTEGTGVALITITIFGLIGMLIYPLALTWLELSKTGYALFCATTLHMTGLIKIAAAALGESSVKLALAIKMARTAMIIPAVLFLSWFVSSRDKERKSYLRSVPWFMWVFVLMGLAFSFIPQLTPLALELKPYAGILFTIALTSIGLTVDLKRIVNAGGGPLIVGLSTWLGAIIIFLLGNLVFRY